MSVDYQAVCRARDVIARRLMPAPVLAPPDLAEWPGLDARLKLELFQPTGSLKLRGVLNWMAQAPSRALARGLVTVTALAFTPRPVRWWTWRP